MTTIYVTKYSLTSGIKLETARVDPDGWALVNRAYLHTSEVPKTRLLNALTP